MPYVCALSEDLQKKALVELHEKPEWRQRDLDTFRDMILSNKGIHCQTDDAFLLRFLRARKFNYDRAYELLVNYLTIRVTVREMFSNFVPSSIKSCLQQKLVTFLPNRDEHGRRMIYARIGLWDPDTVPVYDVMKLENMVLEQAVKEEETQINGFVYIGDFGGMGVKHAKHMESKASKIMTSIFQDGFPLRFKAMHVVNEPAIFHTVFLVIKSFLKSKFLSRIHMHGTDHAALHKHVAPALLPQELGGELGPGNDIATNWYKQLEASESMFADMAKNRIEIMKDISSKKKEDVNAASVTGTFRKLNVD